MPGTVLSLALVVGTAAAQAEQYKRDHQEVLRLVIDGKTKAALDRLAALVERDADDPETWFAKSAACAVSGRTDDALDSAERAVALGLPLGRFLAPPRSWFASLAEEPRFRKLIEAASPLIHGPTLGGLGHDRMRIWVRAGRPATIRVSATADGAEPVEGEAQTGFDETATVQLAGLTPATEYRYEVEVGGQGVGGGSFRTAPAPGAGSRFSIVFGGGAGFVPPHERAWQTIAARAPLALLLLGDNVYIDDPGRPAMQRYTYARRQSRPEWRELTARVPVHAIWDDHDFGTNDCIGGATPDVPPWKPAVSAMFRANWPDPGYAAGDSNIGCWQRLTIGGVDFFMLDGRAWRTDPRGDTPTMLGPVQLEWLHKELAASDARFKVIASPVPWDYRTKGQSLDTWNGFRAERDGLFAWLTERHIEGVVLLSADRHRSDAWRIERPGDYPLHEFSSSRLTNQHVHPEMKAALFSYNDTQSFGEVTFDTTLEDPTVRYDVVTIDGEVVHSLELRRSALTHD